MLNLADKTPAFFALYFEYTSLGDRHSEDTSMLVNLICKNGN